MQAETNRYSLSSHGLANIFGYPFEKDFTFKVGEHEYHVPKALALFISPRITDECVEKRSLNEFEIKMDDSNHEFNLIMDLLSGGSITISEMNATYLLQIGKELQNQDIIQIVNSFLATPLSSNNVFIRLKQKTIFGEDVSSEIAYIASNFSKIDTEDLKQLDNNTLLTIFQSQKFCLDSESFLFEFIIQIINERGDSAKYLLESVYFENLNDSDMEILWNYVSMPELKGHMMESIKRRLSHQPLSDDISAKRYSMEIRKLFYTTNPFSGIFDYLTKTFKGNPHSKNIIEIIPSSSSSSSNYVRLLDYNWDNYWASSNRPNSYIRFNFKQYKVKINAYTLKSRSESPGGGHPKSWVIEGSNDGSSWEVIDTRDNDSCINGSRLVHTFTFPNISKPYQYVQMKLTSQNHRGDNFFNLTNIELFGVLIEPSKEKEKGK